MRASLSGSVISSFLGVLVSTDFDSLPVTAVAGATARTIVFGFAGLRWEPKASERRLRTLAFIVGIVSLLVIAAIHVAAIASCYYPNRRVSDSCLPYWDGGTQTLVAANAAVVVLLVVVQAGQASVLTHETRAFEDL